MSTVLADRELTPSESAALSRLADDLRPRVAAWYESQIGLLRKSRDRMVALAADAHEAATTGTLTETLVLLELIEDEEFEATGECTIGSELHAAFPVDDAESEEIARLAEELEKDG